MNTQTEKRALELAEDKVRYWQARLKHLAIQTTSCRYQLKIYKKQLNDLSFTQEKQA